MALNHLNLWTLNREVVERVWLDFSDRDAVLFIEERFDCSACRTSHVEPALKCNNHHRVPQWKDGFGVERENFLDGWREVICHLTRCSMT
jgi:hypothetical protein